VGLGFLATTVFAWMLLVATLLHWDKFHHGTGAFRLWLWVYLVTPVIVPAVWAWNRRHDPAGRGRSRLECPTLLSRSTPDRSSPFRTFPEALENRLRSRHFFL
jgi:hypothetical protein